MLKLLENLNLRQINYTSSYRISTSNIQYELGKIRLKLETAKSETYLLAIEGRYSTASYKKVPANYNVMIDTATIDIRDNSYYIPEEYTILTATDLLNQLLTDIQTKTIEFLITDDNVILNLSQNPISKIYILGNESNKITLPVYSEIHRLQDKKEL